MGFDSEQRNIAAGAPARPPKTGRPARRFNTLWHAFATGTGHGTPESVGRVLHSAGRRLDPGVEHEMAPNFEGDSSQVRIHTGGSAAASARSLGARAYTSGKDIVFGDGQYSPGTQSGRSLLKHELGHVAQQSEAPGGSPAIPSIGPQNSAAESAVDGNGPGPDGSDVSVPPGAVMREPDPAASARAVRLNALDSLADSIAQDSGTLRALRQQLNALPPASSPDLDQQRETLNTEIRQDEDALMNLLQQRIDLLDSEVMDLNLSVTQTKSAASDPEPGTSSTIIDELARRQMERLTDRKQLVSLQRGRTKQDLEKVNADLASLPAGPTLEYMRLKAEQSRLGNMLSDTAVNRAKPGTAGKGSDGRVYVVYEHEVKVGGALPWVNNNPGNVTSGSAAQGVIGFNPAGIGFAVFRDVESGKKAAASWWQNHKDVTLGSAIFAYSQGIEQTPQHDKDAEDYTRFVEQMTKLDRSRTVGSLSDSEMSSLVTAVLTKEGGLSALNEGLTVTCGDPSGPIEYRRLLGCEE